MAVLRISWGQENMYQLVASEETVRDSFVPTNLSTDCADTTVVDFRDAACLSRPFFCHINDVVGFRGPLQNHMV